MRENITKVAERGERLDSLQDKTGALTAVAPTGSADGPSISSRLRLILHLLHTGWICLLVLLALLSRCTTAHKQTTSRYLHRDSVAVRTGFARCVLPAFPVRPRYADARCFRICGMCIASIGVYSVAYEPFPCQRWKDMKVRPYLSLFCHSLDLTPFVDAHHNRCRHRGHHHHYRGLRSEGDEVGAALIAYGCPSPGQASIWIGSCML